MVEGERIGIHRQQHRILWGWPGPPQLKEQGLPLGIQALQPRAHQKRQCKDQDPE